MRTIFISVLILFSLSLDAQEKYTTSNKKAIARFETAKRYYILRDYQNAASGLMEAVETDPEFVEAWLLLGQSPRVGIAPSGRRETELASVGELTAVVGA